MKIKTHLKSFICLSIVFMIILSSLITLSLNKKTVTIYYGNTTKKIITLSNNVNEIIKTAGLKLSATDKISFSGIKNGYGTITVTKCIPVIISADGKTKDYILPVSKVSDAIKSAGITLTEDDMVSPSRDAVITSGLKINIDRVQYKYVTEQEVLAYNETLMYSSTLSSGQVQSSDGKNGLKRYTYQYKMVNGKITESVLISEEIVAAPVNGKKVVGTKKQYVKTSAAVKCISTLLPVSPIKLDASGKPLSFTKVIKGRATAYTAYGKSRTATGKVPQPGYIAVNPKIIPYGTKLYIKTSDGKIVYGYAVAADTGGFIKSGKVIADLYFNTKGECINFGVRNVDIYVLS